MNDAEMEEHGGSQPPPFAILGGGSKVSAPRQLYTVGRMPQSRSIDQHGAKDEQIGGDQERRHRNTGCALIKQIVE